MKKGIFLLLLVMPCAVFAMDPQGSSASLCEQHGILDELGEFGELDGFGELGDPFTFEVSEDNLPRLAGSSLEFPPRESSPSLPMFEAQFHSSGAVPDESMLGDYADRMKALEEKVASLGEDNRNAKLESDRMMQQLAQEQLRTINGAKGAVTQVGILAQTVASLEEDNRNAKLQSNMIMQQLVQYLQQQQETISGIEEGVGGVNNRVEVLEKITKLNCTFLVRLMEKGMPPYRAE